MPDQQSSHGKARFMLTAENGRLSAVREIWKYARPVFRAHHAHTDYRATSRISRRNVGLMPACRSGLQTTFGGCG
jgi:hypothetical protein